ncbi:uncharacterized protein N7483_005081 [Penicillium malachiteum]|uniref:uncharacterized protein n=1 Tax=Penicillium malachiteum TaxID=1324776 RepID=UPI00254686D0|nr:uncharacterized protein N7483_005081 [Penicillium malachiteum]KAJ5730573.1 hypothetical protein N7483_005081 [Penicillium malachiteum]
MNYRIERVEKDDLPFLGKFIHSAKLALSINRLLYLNWPNEELQRPNSPLLAEINNAVNEIGKETEEMDRFEITYMCVKPTAQRKGIGSRLVQLGFDRAKAWGIPLKVCAEAPSIPFFTSIGFVETRHVNIDLGKYAADNSGFGIFRHSGMIWCPE